MTIRYRVNPGLTVDQFLELLHSSGLAARRPVEDRDCIQGMLEGGNLLVSAWDGTQLVGISRSLTDFHYACYLSDLAVDRAYQKQGIGRELIARTRQHLGEHCRLILLAAPAARDYYPHLGFEQHPDCWTLPAGGQLK